MGRRRSPLLICSRRSKRLMTVIRVPTDFDRDALDRLLAVVEAR
jgi:hypothetical protein